MTRIIDGIEYNVTEDNFLEKNGLRFIENENSSTSNTSLALIDVTINQGESLTIVVLPDACNTICENAFSQCKKTIQCVIGKNVKHIEPRAFANCSKLTKVYFSLLKSIGDYAFVNTSLEYMPNLSGIENGIGICAFWGSKIRGYIDNDGKEAHGYIEIPKNISELNSVFGRTKISLVYFENGGHYKLNKAFEDCKNLMYCNLFDEKKEFENTTLELGEFDFAGTNISDVCIKPWVDLSHAKSTFISSLITDLIVENESVPEYFCGRCRELKNVILGNECKRIKYCAFCECKKLQDVYLNNVLTVASHAFLYSGIRKISGNANYGSGAFESSSLESIELNGKVSKNIFKYCNHLRKVIIKTPFNKIEDNSLPVSVLLDYENIPCEKIDFDVKYFFDYNYRTSRMESENQDILVALKNKLAKYEGGYYYGSDDNPYETLVIYDGNGEDLRKTVVGYKEVIIHPDCKNISSYAIDRNFLPDGETKRFLTIDRQFRTIGGDFHSNAFKGIDLIKIENKAMFESMEKHWKYDKVILGDDLDLVKNPFEIINPDGTIVFPKVVNEMVVTKEPAILRRMDIVLPTKITNVVITNYELSKYKSEADYVHLHYRPGTKREDLQKMIDDFKKIFCNIPDKNFMLTPYDEKDLGIPSEESIRNNCHNLEDCR